MAGPNLQPHVSDTDEHGNEIPNNTPPPTTTNNEENQTPAAAAVTIIFRTANGAEVSFKLKPTTKLKKAMDAYAAREGQERTVLRFLFEGERVLDDSTAASVSCSFFGPRGLLRGERGGS